MALSIVAQAVNAVSAPCPMLDAAMTDAEHQMMMNMPGHDMASMNHPSMSSADSIDDTPKVENCCGDESCPMNTFVMGFVFSQPTLIHTATITLTDNFERAQLYLSRSTASLYRPPIFA